MHAPMLSRSTSARGTPSGALPCSNSSTTVLYGTLALPLGRSAAAGRGARRAPAPRRWRARARSPSDSEFEGVEGGDEALQRELEAQLRLQLRSEELKESIKEDLRSKVEEVKQISEELHAELEEGYRIERFRNDLETQEALASAMERFDELEDEIAAMKAQLQADREDLAAWEKAAAAARSKGLFFKTLYAPDADPAQQKQQKQGQEQQDGAGGQQQRRAGAAGGGESGSGGGGRFGGEVRGSLDPEVAAAARRVAAKVQAPAEVEVGSPMRLWLFAYMAAILALVVGQDLTTAEPSLGLDALYGVLGLILGFTAWNERQLIASRGLQGPGGPVAGDGDRPAGPPPP